MQQRLIINSKHRSIVGRFWDRLITRRHGSARLWRTSTQVNGKGEKSTPLPQNHGTDGH